MAKVYTTGRGGNIHQEPLIVVYSNRIKSGKLLLLIGYIGGVIIYWSATTSALVLHASFFEPQTITFVMVLLHRIGQSQTHYPHFICTEFKISFRGFNSILPAWVNDMRHRKFDLKMDLHLSVFMQTSLYPYHISFVFGDDHIHIKIHILPR